MSKQDEQEKKYGRINLENKKVLNKFSSWCKKKKKKKSRGKLERKKYGGDSVNMRQNCSACGCQWMPVDGERWVRDVVLKEPVFSRW